MRAQWNRDDLERAEHGQLRFTQEQANLIRARAIQLGLGESARSIDPC